MPRLRRKKVKKSGAPSGASAESVAAKLSTNQLAQIMNDPSLSADAVLTSDSIVSFELLKKVWESGSPERTALENFQKEQSIYLLEAVNLLKSNREIMHTFGNDMLGARKLANVLKGRAKTIAFEKHIDTSAKAAGKALTDFNPDDAGLEDGIFD